MWDIFLGHTPSGFLSHWEMVFRYDAGTEDASCECPESCEDANCLHGPDPGFFELDLRQDRLIPISRTHILHVVQYNEDDDDFSFEHLRLGGISRDIILSDLLGTCGDSSLSKIVRGCRYLPVPRDGRENCQTWVRKALKEVVDGLADLDEEFEKIVDRVKGKEADRYIGEDGEDGEGDDAEDGEGDDGEDEEESDDDQDKGEGEQRLFSSP
jgi:hypothetical protein